MNQKTKKHSTRKYFQFLPPLNKDGLISEGILTLVPLPTKGAKSLLSRIFEFYFHFSKLTAQESNLIPFVINGAKIKIPYENKRPLGKTYEKI